MFTFAANRGCKIANLHSVLLSAAISKCYSGVTQYSCIVTLKYSFAQNGKSGTGFSSHKYVSVDTPQWSSPPASIQIRSKLHSSALFTA